MEQSQVIKKILKKNPDMILETTGSEGVLREAAQILLNAHGTLQQALKLYIKNSTG